MSTTESQQSAQDAMVASMGAELGNTFFALYNEVVWLHAVWQEYRVIYGTSEEKLQVANRAAGFFFRIVQDELWNSVLLRIARLTDSPKTMGKTNLTIRALPTLIVDSTLSQEVKALVEVALAKSEFAREHRHKRLAHQDLACATDASVSLRETLILPRGRSST
ncbi:MAG TPA: hypothetical protein VN679_10425 [Candidatus Acidoferrales bacterium]|nr:hypothetical protein [Candidatus Acidoferrales bacterium]